MLEMITLVFSKMFAIYSTQIPIIIGLAVLFTVLTVFESQAASPGKVWWRNPGMPTDICYALVHALLTPYFKIPAFLVITLLLSGSMTPNEIEDYFTNGRGPLSGLSFFWQSVVYLLLTDFLLYWIHRGFHGAMMWRFHAIHHSAEQVDWTTTYRFHPVNLMLQPSLVAMIMIALGISPQVMAFFIAWDILSAAFVHANVNWTFGPLKYVIATPVFHRWHHGPANDGGSSNFAPTFAFWDVMFGTFYMPEGRLPQNFGVDDLHFPQTYLSQLTYPFRQAPAESPAAPLTTSQQPN
jgi:sterol desaturase/sphingolipid hydroxylase (fatty acid hydroxylase superfamily)